MPFGNPLNDSEFTDHALMIEYGDFSTIFSGDAEGETEDQSVMNFGDTLQTTVLMGSHHGATTHQSNDTDWANATKPDVIVFSAGTRFGHLKCAAVSRYRPHSGHSLWNSIPTFARSTSAGDSGMAIT